MKFNMDFILHSKEKPGYGDIPIKGVSEEVREKFKNKDWRRVPINEIVQKTPKHLETVPNFPVEGKAMAWPAYYKTVKLGLEKDGQLKGFGELAQAIEGQIQTSPIVKIRSEIKNMLDRAQKALDAQKETSGLQLVLVDGYRRIDVQKRLFDAYHNYVISNNPGLTESATKDIARKMVSEPPADLNVLRESPPPHSTGGSADVILVFKNKIDIKSDYWLNDAMVPFGAEFDEMMNPIYKDERSETVFYEEKSKKEELTVGEKEALKYRRILYNVLTEAGFSNYYTEFWHYDFGNQFHAITADKDEAIYGYAGGIDGDQIIENMEAEEKAYQAYRKIHGEDAEQVKSHFGL